MNRSILFFYERFEFFLFDVVCRDVHDPAVDRQRKKNKIAHTYARGVCVGT